MIIKKLFQITCFSALLLGLGACGGGGGELNPAPTAPATAPVVAPPPPQNVLPTTAGLVVTTFAGSNTFFGRIDGPALSARFTGATGGAFDSKGNLFVADSANNNIRKVTSGGDVTTFAGNGTAGFLEGQGAAAEFDNPLGLVIDGADNIYIADSGNGVVRKITSSGLVSTFAGSEKRRAVVDGLGRAAGFFSIAGIALDSTGTFYVTDLSSVRKISKEGLVSTLAGSDNLPKQSTDGVGSAATFIDLGGVAVDRSGTVYVAETGLTGAGTFPKVRKITASGVVTTLAGGTFGNADGFGSAAKFSFAHSGLTVDDTGNIFVADTNNGRVCSITPAGVVTTYAGKVSTIPTDGPIATATLGRSLRGVVFDKSGRLFTFEGTAVRRISAQ